MTYEDYVNEIVADGKEYIKETLNYLPEQDFDRIYDYMFVSSVTGNDNGSYYCNAYKAEQAVKDVIYDNWFVDMCKEFGIFEHDNPIEMLFDAEAMDVSVRCYLLGFSDVYDQLKDYYDELTENNNE